MAVGWTGVGPELLVGLDRGLGESLGSQPQRQVREAIRSGRLESGERLPSSRSLADQVGVSRGLVVDCYSQLESEGYVVSVVGAGTHVAFGISEAQPVESRPLTATRLLVDFEFGVPDLSRFPMHAGQRGRRYARPPVSDGGVAGAGASPRVDRMGASSRWVHHRG